MKAETIDEKIYEIISGATLMCPWSQKEEQQASKEMIAEIKQLVRESFKVQFMNEYKKAFRKSYKNILSEEVIKNSFEWHEKLVEKIILNTWGGE